MIKSPDRSVRCNAGLVLARLGDDRGLAAVVAELNDAAPRPAPGRTRSDGRPDVSGQVRQDRYYAAHVLGEMRDKRAVPALVATFGNPDLAYKAAYALSQIGDAAAVAPLRRLMGESGGDTRLAAAHALAKLGAPDGLPVVAGFLGDKEWTVRRRAAESLAELKDRNGVPPLLGALKDSDVNVRVAAARALGEIADPAALTALAALDGDEQTTTAGPPVSVRQAARDAADRINKASPRPGG
jgi:HEAT repeat protein